MSVGMIRSGILGWLALVSAVGAGEPQTVTIRGQQHAIWPVADLRARGFDVLQVPRDENAAWVYIEAINAYEEMPASLEDAFSYAYGTAWPTGHAELVDYLKLAGNRRAMELAERAAGTERCQIPYFGDPNGSILAVLLPNLSGMRMVGKLLVADGKRLEAEDDFDKAVTNHLTAMRMGTHISHGTTLIEGLVGLSVCRVANAAVIDMVLRRPLTAKQLRTLHRQLQDYAQQVPTIQRGLQGERTFGPALVDELCSRPLQLVRCLRSLDSDGWLSSAGSSNPTDGWGRLELRIGRLVLPDRAVKRHMRGYYDEVIKRAEKGPHKAVESDFDEERYLTETIPRWDVVSRMLLPSLSRATTYGERAQADLAALRTIVAIRLYMLEHYGAIPASLDELEGRLAPTAMIDPFSGDLLVYRPGEAGWLLYSVGPDLVDDGGQQGERWDRLDRVYRFPPEPIEPFAVSGGEE